MIEPIDQTDIGVSWYKILQLTEQFKQLTDEGLWPEASALAVLRHKTITQHFQQYPVGPATAEFYVQHLNNFMHQEELLKQQAIKARKMAMKEGMIINTNKKAINAYNTQA